VTTYRLGFPSELKRRLECTLPRHQGCSLGVRVTPRDRAERKCPVYEADHYEVQVYYSSLDPALLDQLEKALRDLPGVYRTTQVLGTRGRNEVTNPEWPAALGLTRRGFHEMRPQVLALIGD
jgi:hypothetical protein